MSAYDEPSRIWVRSAIRAALDGYTWPEDVQEREYSADDRATLRTAAQAADDAANRGRAAGRAAAVVRAAADPRLAELLHRRTVLGQPWQRISDDLGYGSAGTALRVYRRHQRRTKEASHAAD